MKKILSLSFVLVFVFSSSVFAELYNGELRSVSRYGEFYVDEEAGLGYYIYGEPCYDEDGKFYWLFNYPNGTSKRTYDSWRDENVALSVDDDSIASRFYDIYVDDETGYEYIIHAESFYDENGKLFLVFNYPDGTSKVSDVVVDDSVSEDTSTSAVPSEASITPSSDSVPDLDSAIDELCSEYSITEQDLYFYLLNAILDDYD